MFPGEVILNGPPRKEIALTFDDGPDDTWTPLVLDVLRKHNVKATFMCVGKRAAANPQVLRRMFQEKHIIGNHSWDHPNLTKIPIKEVINQIKRCEDEIHRIIGVRTRFLRPPYGALNEEIIREAIKLNYRIIYWDVDSLDWDGLTARQVAHNILYNIRPGAIVLQHSAGGRGESLEDTVRALPVVIETLRREGYRLVTITELLKISPYK
ncbi:polysaccharide deacetylase family protein [Aneurinibacillus terranovensis]|uniref:polysaccharide deacetylase family protein n=1 Tax=Aneurinibacillus terranovensis TaxID=278991 RepID=UPI0004203A79|nr:polysaccharide deacetylase family protein [Aneurinibacillus terranovensis]